jgi:hypothetical protein
LKDPSWLGIWKAALPTSRFFEQAALEEVAKAAKDGLYEFDMNHNYGWWRMFQSPNPPTHQKEMFAMNRSVGAGITVENLPLCSIHTHFTERVGAALSPAAEPLDFLLLSSPAKRGKTATEEFNLFIGRQLGKLEKHHPPAYKLAMFIAKCRTPL